MGRLKRGRPFLWLSILALILTAVNFASTGQQHFSTSLPDDGSFSVDIIRQDFFPQACAGLTWESSGLEQILLNGEVVAVSGSTEQCSSGDVISTFLLVSEDFETATTYSYRTTGAFGIPTLVLVAARILVLISRGYRNWAPSPSRAQSKREIAQTAAYNLQTVILRILTLSAMLASIQLIYLLLFHEPVTTWLTYWLYLTFGVLVPGTMLVMRFTRWQTDFLTWVALGWALGHAIELFSLQIAKVTGIPSLFLLWIPAAYAITLRSKIDWNARMRRLAGRWQPVVFFLLAITAAIFISLNLPELSPRPPYISDVWFHINNAHEFRDYAQTQDPRLAGEPFNYHMFGYAPYAAASLATGAPVANLLTRFGGLSAVWLLTLLVFCVGREVGRGSLAAGMIAALLVVMPIDLLALFSISLSTSASLMLFGIYVSSTTLAGHIYLAALLLPILWYFRAQSLSSSWVIPLFAAAGAGSKSMFGVLVMCGLLGTYGLEVLLTRRFRSRTLPLLVVVAIPTLLITAQLVFGAGSYSESVRWSYADFSGYTRFYQALNVYTGDVPTRTLWLMGFTALFLVGAAVATRFAGWRAESSHYFTFLWMMFFASLIPAMGIALTGASQLFFLYFSLAGLATVAGYGLVTLIQRVLASHPLRLTTAVAALTLFLSAQFVFVPPNVSLREQLLPIYVAFSRTVNWLPYAFAADTDLPRAAPFTEAQGVYASMLTMTDDLRAGLGWARDNLSKDTVFVVNVPEASAYAGLSEHRAFYETEMFSVYSHIAGGLSEHFQKRRDLLADWRSGEADVLERMREAGITHIYLDSVNGFAVPNVESLSPVFQNEDLTIYALSASI